MAHPHERTALKTKHYDLFYPVLHVLRPLEVA